MLEELAKAMVTVLEGGPPDTPYPIEIEAARAVLERLREPSNAVVDAGIDVLTERGCNPMSGDAEAVWQAMIDATLSKGSHHD